MKTSKEFNQNLKEKKLTMEMVEQVLFSINKRAKNCRDKKNEYYLRGKNSGYKNDYAFNTVEKYKMHENEYYSQKYYLINTLLRPKCIHQEVLNKDQKVRYYDYEEEFEENKKNAIYTNSYYDKETQVYIEFIDIFEAVIETKDYLFYQTSNYSFHIPIIKSDMWDLETITISDFNTEGKEVIELLSCQFCKKVIDLVKSEDYITL